MTTKRRVLLDGNGSSQINVEGLGVYVPASELAQLKSITAERDQLAAKLTKLDELASRFIEDSEEIAEFFDVIGGRNHLVLAKDIREIADAMADLLNDQSQINLHIDDVGINNLTNAMRLKMAYARSKGRCGWDDPAQCSGEQLAKMLVEHLTKGNAGTFEDVANFAMMLHQRKESPSLLADAINAVKESVVIELETVLIEASDNAGVNGYLEEAQAMADAVELIRARAQQIIKIKDAEAA